MAPPHNNSNKKRKKKRKGGRKQNASGDFHDEEIPMQPPKQVKTPKKEKESKKSQSASKLKESSPQQRPNTTSKNPLLEAHKAFMATQCTPQERDDFFSNTLLDADRRGALWMEQADRGEDLVNQYSWAIPDDRAMRILKHFSPIVEIGCGANAYWSRLMAQVGVDIVAYDMFPEAGGQIMESNNNDGKGKNKKRKRKSQGETFQVQKGGPEVLSSKKLRGANRTLFLCYSDEEAMQPTPEHDNEEDGEQDDEEEEDERQPEMTSLGTECLRHYTGDYIIHVGELYGDTTSMDQAPWGRSSGAEFQQELAATFHCLLRVSLPNWIHVRDTLSVWKRSETCSIVFAADSDDEEDDEEGDMEVEYKHIPVSERLPTDLAAPCLAHLLTPSKKGSTDSNPEDPTLKSKAKGGPPNQKKKNDQAQEMPSSSSDDDDAVASGSDSSEDKQLKKKQRHAKVKKDSSSSDEEDEDYEVQW